MKTFEELIKLCDPLAKSLARKFASPEFSFDDLYSVALGELPNVHRKFDAKRNVRFTTYAYSLMRYAIKTHIRKFSSLKVFNVKNLIERRQPYAIPNLDVILKKADYLTKNERTVLHMRFSFEVTPLKECGRLLKLSAGRISQIEKTALLKLSKHRKELENETES